MRAKLIKENFDFERGLDPKKSLGVGKYSLQKDFEYYDDMVEYFVRNLDKIIGPKLKDGIIKDKLDEKTFEKTRALIIELLKDCVIHDMPNSFDPVIAFVDIFYELSERNNIKESVQFQRGKDPKSALDLGIARYSLRNHRGNDDNDLINEAIAEEMELSQDEIFFLGDTKYSEASSEMLGELTDIAFDSDRIKQRELSWKYDTNYTWTVVIETYESEIGKILTLEGTDYFQIYGDLNVLRYKINKYEA